MRIQFVFDKDLACADAQKTPVILTHIVRFSVVQQPVLIYLDKNIHAVCNYDVYYHIDFLFVYWRILW